MERNRGKQMRRSIILILIGLIIVAFCACTAENSDGRPGSIEDTKESTFPVTEPTETKPVLLSFGETIKTEMFEFTPSFEGFAKNISNWPDKDYLTPKGKNIDLDTNPYRASTDKVYMYFSGTVKYTGDSKDTETLTLQYIVDYDNGYIFDGNHDYNSAAFSAPSSSNGKNNEGTNYHTVWGNTSEITNSQFEDWNYSNSMSFAPLSSNNKRIVRFAIEVPKVLVTNKDKSLMVVFTIEGVNYSFAIR